MHASALNDPALPEILPAACEKTLALSAAPEHLRTDATVFVLEESGYTKAQTGTNGFTCLVNRDHPRVLKPTCFDAEGTRTIVPKILDVGRWLREGANTSEVRQRIKEGFEEGSYKSPTRAGVAYMLSRYNRPYNSQADELGWFPPHVMFYAPNLTPSDIGFSMEAWHGNRPLPSIGYQGPHGYMIMPSDDGEPRRRSDLPGCPDWVHE